MTSLSELKRLALTEPDPRVQAQYAAELVRKAEESARKRSTFYDDGFRDGKAGKPKAPPADYRGTTVNAQDYEDGYRDGEAERKAGKSARPAMHKAHQAASPGILWENLEGFGVLRTISFNEVVGLADFLGFPKDKIELLRETTPTNTTFGAELKGDTLRFFDADRRQTVEDRITAPAGRGKSARPKLRKADKPRINKDQIESIVNIDLDNPPVIGGITVTSRAFHPRYGLLVSVEGKSGRFALNEIFDVPPDLEDEYGNARSKAARPKLRKANPASLPNVIRDVKQMAQVEGGARMSDEAAEWIITQIVGRNPANYEKVYSVSTARLKRLIQQAQDKGF